MPTPPSPADPEDEAVSGSSAEALLGTSGIARRAVGPAESSAASRAWWDADADDYQAEHGGFLGDDDFVWCPERLREQDARLLGPRGALRGARVLEVGCGAASCSRFLAGEGARVVGLDLSAGMLRHARAADARTGTAVPLVQGDAGALPLADDTVDAAFSAFGAIPFVADPAAVMREVARVLRPGAPWVFAVNHPMRWAFPDDPGPDGLTVSQSYFDRTPYAEVDDDGRVVYVEHHRTLGDRVADIVASGLVLERLVEPEWPKGLDAVWGQWSPLRGALFPGTAIFCCRRPGAGGIGGSTPSGPRGLTREGPP
nr:class I SAM-dependent methyltransferase [Actinomycetospora cinnamomea]